MFELDWEKLLVIAVVAIVVIGPKDLPRALRAVGQWTSKARRMAREFQNQFNEAIREAELDVVQRDIEAIAKIDPVADVREAAAKAGADIRQDLQTIAPPPTPPVAAPAAEAAAAMTAPLAPAEAPPAEAAPTQMPEASVAEQKP
jgi:sec-independent protein translocase protein TatB